MAELQAAVYKVSLLAESTVGLVSVMKEKQTKNNTIIGTLFS